MSRTDVRPGGVAAWIPFWASRRPDQPCVIFEDEVTTWSGFDAAVNRLAGHLWQAGVRRGERVGCLMPNRPEYLVTFWAALHLGAIFVPYNVRLAPPELAAVIGDSDPVTVITDGTFAAARALVDELRPTHWLDTDALTAGPAAPAEFEVPWLAGDDPAAIVYTSGTTGRSKGAVLTHGNFLHQSVAWTSSFGLSGRDRTINLMSLCYAGGLLNPTLNTFQTGATVVLEPRFDAESALRRIEKYRITWITATPQLVEAILTHPRSAQTDLSSVGWIQSGGAPVPIPLAELAARRGIDLIQGFGITEATAGINVFLPPEDVIRKAGSIGKPAPYDEVRVVDASGSEVAVGEVGEMLLRGPLVMQGYWRNQAATDQALAGGWLHTGDLARVDEEGFISLVGRKKEMIISGGLNVYPVEVEQVLQVFPEVAEVAVVGLPDRKWGERVTAFVVIEPGQTLTEEELIARSRGHLAGYRIPKTVRFVTDLPRTTSGKVRKLELVRQWQSQQ